MQANYVSKKEHLRGRISEVFSLCSYGHDFVLSVIASCFPGTPFAVDCRNRICYDICRGIPITVGGVFSFTRVKLLFAPIRNERG